MGVSRRSARAGHLVQSVEVSYPVSHLGHGSHPQEAITSLYIDHIPWYDILPGQLSIDHTSVDEIYEVFNMLACSVTRPLLKFPY